MEIRAISYAQILDAPNARELVAEYAAECSIPEIGVINPQREMYAKAEKAGTFRSFGAFRGEELVGFASVLVFLLPHYGQKIATVESIFLAARERPSWAGNSLMNAIEQFTREQGCKVILYNARAGSRFEKLLSLMKPYKRTNSVFLLDLT